MTNFVSDIITYVRRIIKTPSTQVLTDSLIIDYINRFWIIDVDARLQMFDFKTKYQFQTTPGVDQYNMPLYSIQSQSSSGILPAYNISLTSTNGTANYTANLLTGLTANTLNPGTVEIWIDKGAGDQTLYTDSAGVLTQVFGTYSINAGTVNYTTGIITLAFSVTPAANLAVVANFQYTSILAGSTIAMYPVYQNMLGPVFINGVQMPIYTQRSQFFNIWPNYNQMLVQAGTGNGSSGPYTLNLPFLQNNPNTTTQVDTGLIRGHVDITGIIDTGANIDPPLDTTGLGNYIQNPSDNPQFIGQGVIRSTSIYPGIYFTSIGLDGALTQICDTGILLDENQNFGLLMTPGPAPYGNSVLTGGYSSTQNTINYQSGIATNIFFSQPIPAGNPIQAQAVYYQTGIPRAVLFYNNTLTFRAPPNTAYLIEIDAYLTPAAFFSTNQMAPFAYMCEYIARGAARKILSDTGDWEQFNAYEPLFQEQELLVWKRSQRQFTATRTPTIYSTEGAGFQNNFNQSSFGV